MSSQDALTCDEFKELAVGDEAARRRGLYHLCGFIVAAALVGLYLYNAPAEHIMHLRAMLSAAQTPAAH